MLGQLRPAMDGDRLEALQAAVRDVHVSDALLDYAQALVTWTRESPDIELGVSPRGAVDLISAARAWALFQGHSGVQPEDLQAVFVPVAGHRLHPRDSSQVAGEVLARMVLDSVEVP